MISDQQLATREREIAKLFLGLRTGEQERAIPHPSTDRIGEHSASPTQRIEQILRRVEDLRKDGRLPGSTGFPHIATERRRLGD